MQKETENYHAALSAAERAICDLLYAEICANLPGADHKIWHAHPVWFLDGNPVAGYSKTKNGIRLMFWSGASFGEENLKPGTGKFKDASITYAAAGDVNPADLRRWLAQSIDVQWDYKNVVKRKGVLERLK